MDQKGRWVQVVEDCTLKCRISRRHMVSLQQGIAAGLNYWSFSWTKQLRPVSCSFKYCTFSLLPFPALLPDSWGLRERSLAFPLFPDIPDDFPLASGYIFFPLLVDELHAWGWFFCHCFIASKPVNLETYEASLGTRPFWNGWDRGSSTRRLASASVPRNAVWSKPELRKGSSQTYRWGQILGVGVREPPRQKRVRRVAWCRFPRLRRTSLPWVEGPPRPSWGQRPVRRPVGSAPAAGVLGWRGAPPHSR